MNKRKLISQKSQARKLIFIFITLGMLVICWDYAKAVEVEILLSSGYFQPSETAFRDIYGGGLTYGGQLNLKLASNWRLWVSLDYFSRSGQLTFTKEETELTIMPLGLGATYFQSLPPAEVYLALGMHYFKYTESNPIGVAEKGGSGMSIEPGVAIKLFRGVLLRVYLKYS
ncbi:MAG: hypothetical protein JRI56_12305, partial [Deltaproteobacteria bacterium]|nr:hypothetical protein [Deltaproteobacteria bacterium]